MRSSSLHRSVDRSALRRCVLFTLIFAAAWALAAPPVARAQHPDGAGQPPVVAGECVPELDTTIGDPGLSASVMSFTVFNGRIIAAGGFHMSGDRSVPAIAEWDGSQWNPIGGETIGVDIFGPEIFEATVYEVIVFDNGAGDGPRLIAIGELVRIGGVDIHRIAQWDGQTWSPLGDGRFNGYSATIFESPRAVVFNDGSGPALYVPNITSPADGITTNSFAKWDGNNWAPVPGIGHGLNDYVITDTAAIDAAQPGGPRLFVSLALPWPNSPGHRIVAFDGQNWEGLLLEDFSHPGAPPHHLEIVRHQGAPLPTLYVGWHAAQGTGHACAGTTICRFDGTSWSTADPGEFTAHLVANLAAYDDGTGGGEALFAVRRASPNGDLWKFDGSQWELITNGTLIAGAMDTLSGLNDSGPVLALSLNELNEEFAGYAALWGGCANEPPSTVKGRIWNIQTGQGIAGATVSGSGASSTTTNAQGEYQISDFPSGGATLSINADGFYPVDETLTTQPHSTTIVNVALQSSLGGNRPIVAYIRTGYSSAIKRAYFLSGIPLNETCEATIDWRGYPPGEVRYLTPAGDVQATLVGNTWRASLPVGSYPPGSTVRVKAVSANGYESVERPANLRVVSPPPGLPTETLSIVSRGNALKYQLGAGALFEIVDEGVGTTTIPANLPVFGASEFKVGAFGSPSGSVQSDGTASLRLFRIEVPEERRTKIAGVEFLPSISGSLLWGYRESESAWLPGGEARFGFNVSGPAPRFPVWFVAGPCPVCVPAYWRTRLSIGIQASVEFRGWNVGTNDPVFNGTFSLDPFPQVEGMLGIGVPDLQTGDPILAIESFIGGRARMGFQYPQEPTLNALEIGLYGGIRLIAFSYQWESAPLEYTWSLLPAPHRPLAPDRGWRSLDRSYLGSGPNRAAPDYARFVANTQPDQPAYAGAGGITTETTIVQDTFPYAKPAITAIGDDLLAVWIHDDPNRSPINRTLLHYSYFDASTGQWSVPAPVDDDGTADFTAHLATLASGDAVCAWENINAILDEPVDPDDPAQIEAKMQEMRTKTEITVARFDAKTRTWNTSVDLTANTTLDSAPRIAGGAADGSAMVVWSSSDDSDPMGLSQRLWYALGYSIFDPTGWVSPLALDSTTGIITSRDLARHPSGAAALVVNESLPEHALDPAFHEVSAYYFDGFAWSEPVVHTFQGGNLTPRVTPAPDGFSWLVAWRKDDTIRYTADSFLSTQEAFTLPSSAAGDLRLARRADGRIALAWTDMGDDLVDVFYSTFDPAGPAWADPQRLTRDDRREYGAAPAFTASGDLVVAMSRAVIAHELRTFDTPEGPIEVLVPIQGDSDVIVLRRRIVTDLAVDDSGIVAEPGNPAPGEAFNVQVIVINAGDNAVTDALVRLYSGDPQNGGVALGDATIPGDLDAGAAAVATFNVVAPTASLIDELYAVVDPDSATDDANTANNTASLAGMGLPDLVIDAIHAEHVGPSDRLITATLLNIGPAPAPGPHVVTFRRGGPEGEVLGSASINAMLEPGVPHDLAWLWIGAAPFKDGSETVHAILDEAVENTEFSHDNNDARVAVLDPFEQDHLCLTDWDNNGVVNAADVGAFLSDYLLDRANGTLRTDFDGNLTVNAADVGAFLNSYFQELGPCG